MPSEPLEIHVLQETEHTLNFLNYAFRHRTLTLLGEVKQCQEKYDNSSRYKYDVNYFGYENISVIKLKMQELFDEMRLYMRNNDINDKFIKMLCDDIHIAMKTIGTQYGQMCISSRQTSQGTQRIYTVNTTPLDYYDSDSDSEHDIQRAGAPCFNNDSDSDEDIQRAPMSACARPKPKQRACAPSSFCIEADSSDEYEVSNDCMIDSPYLTQTATTVMRTISNISDDSEEDEDSDNSDSGNDSGSDSGSNDIDSDDDELPELIPINDTKNVDNIDDENISGLFVNIPIQKDNNNVGPLTEF
jgi:hypothetical protein